MFPYEKRLKWHVRGPFKHLAEGIRGHPALFEKPHGDVLKRRIDRIETWALVRALLLIPLSASIISTAGAFFVELVGGFGFAETAFSLFAKVASAGAALFGLAYLLATRHLMQLQADIMVLLAMGHAHPENPL